MIYVLENNSSCYVSANYRVWCCRGAVKIWKPKVTPLSQLRPDQMQQVGGEPGEEQYVQKTSLAADIRVMMTTIKENGTDFQLHTPQ